MSNSKKKIQNSAKAESRRQFIAAGGNDGRFNGNKRFMTDKKKEARKNGWE